MGSKSLAFSVLVAASLLSFAPDARAQSLADKETARALMDEGDSKRDKQDFKGALAAYEKADAIMHVPTTGLEVARMQAQLGMLLEARETLSRVVRIPAKPNEPQAFVNARKAADQLNEELAKRVPAVQLVISGVEAGQVPEVTIDKEPLPQAVLNVPRKVNPGLHTIVVKAGSAEKTVEVTVAEKETKTVNIDLKEKPPADPPKGGGVVIDPSEPSSTPKILMYGGFALAAVGIGVGSVTGIMSMGKVSDIEGDCVDNKCKPERATDIDDAKMLGNISTIAFAAGGVGAVVGVIGIIMSSGQKTESSSPPGATSGVKTKPILGAGYVGLGGTF